eukprot:CAMPEP_0194769866 /NCGR_PEP_ID=MMETSP0323_2-20130528/44478_1 /TAXON_ID=2866 ORGANISM="Crypthecodinium cohnii, Strain Seligo" /NCGR_SAMPLE_ID=MMETSP0323_2 /ASSEMBLY_ACC=CAM_ASM_000346 /LENGTH=100 /DNA_ID=CAMNT_0039703097 /DNA_START=335 /DNA_END=636 /DNA_ORIENTATION=+
MSIRMRLLAETTLAKKDFEEAQVRAVHADRLPTVLKVAQATQDAWVSVCRGEAADKIDFFRAAAAGKMQNRISPRERLQATAAGPLVGVHPVLGNDLNML